MRLRPVGRPWRAAAVACSLILCGGWLAGCTADRAASNPTGASRAPFGPGGTTVRVLQLNLCNSGRADCYSGGRAVSLAQALIHRDRPSVVSLNEICRDDVRVLERALSTTFPTATVASAFRSAVDHLTQTSVHCQNGQRYGDGVLTVLPAAAHGARTYGGVYPVQDVDAPEERVWACIDVVTQFSACTTHTASYSTASALAQCRYLLDEAVPTMSHRDGGDPIVLGADLNLAAHGSPSPQSCLPPGYRRVDDGALQDVVVSPGLAVRSSSVIDMRGTTDHPALLVDVVLPSR